GAATRRAVGAPTGRGLRAPAPRCTTRRTRWRGRVRRSRLRRREDVDPPPSQTFDRPDDQEEKDSVNLDSHLRPIARGSARLLSSALLAGLALAPGPAAGVAMAAP